MELLSRQDWHKNKPKDKWESECPFCDRNQHKEYIIWEWKYFKIIHNKFPYWELKNHLLVIPIRCVSHTSNLSSEEYWEFPKIHDFMKKYYWEESYFSFIRERWTAKSIHHLHYHFLPGEIYDIPLEEMLKKQWII